MRVVQSTNLYVKSELFIYFIYYMLQTCLQNLPGRYLRWLQPFSPTLAACQFFHVTVLTPMTPRDRRRQIKTKKHRSRQDVPPTRARRQRCSITIRRLLAGRRRGALITSWRAPARNSHDTAKTISTQQQTPCVLRC